MKGERLKRSFKHLEICKDPITEIEKQTAYELFRRKNKGPTSFQSQEDISCLKQVRESLHLTAAQAANLLGVIKSSYQSYEAGEVSGAISLKNLRKCAEAFNCELVYELRTKDGQPVDQNIWNEAFEATKSHGLLFNCVATRRAYALNDLITKKLNDPKFRREMKWSMQTARFRPLYE